jgi:hypothetical protein
VPAAQRDPDELPDEADTVQPDAAHMDALTRRLSGTDAIHDVADEATAEAIGGTTHHSDEPTADAIGGTATPTADPPLTMNDMFAALATAITCIRPGHVVYIATSCSRPRPPPVFS